MIVYSLDTDEAVILQDSNVKTSGTDITLILTNKHVIQVKKGIFGREKSAFKYPLLDLKELNGKPNVRIGKAQNGEKQLELYFKLYQRVYCFRDFLAEMKWAGAIEKAYRTVVAEARKSEQTENNQGFFAPILNTLDTARHALFFKADETRTMKCPRCGADLVGEKGEQVTCGYCDTIVTIR